jgi:hypothetical protein
MINETCASYFMTKHGFIVHGSEEPRNRNWLCYELLKGWFGFEK